MSNPVLIVVALLSFAAQVLSAQTFLNLDFEYGAYKEQPRKWSIEGEGKYYFASLDSTMRQSGSKSLRVKLEDAETYIFLSLPGNMVAGKKVSFSGFLKSSGTAGPLQLMMAFRDPAGGRPLISNIDMKDQKEWVAVSHQHTFSVYPSNRLLIALIAVGSGEFWFDNAALKIDDADVGRGDPDFREPTRDEVDALNKKSIPLRSTESLSDVTDLTPLGKMIGNTTVVGLGENSHGSATVYKMKLRMVKYLVEKKGFTVFALESPVAEADRIDRYVKQGTGTREDVLRNLVYKSWQTKEMLDIIEWIRVYNSKAKRKVSFQGFDIQNGISAFQEVEIFIKNHNKQLVPDALQLRVDYDQALLTNQHWDSVYFRAKRLSNALLSQKYFPSIKTENLSQIKHYMDVFVQSLSSRYQSSETKSRDVYMAENIRWLMENSPSGNKFIISADNAHVTKETGKMGSWLKDELGKNYFVFGFTFNQGTYFAYGPEKFYEVHPPYAGTYEYLFSSCRYRDFVLDIREVEDIPMLAEKMGFRSIGSRPQETTQFFDMTLQNNFDAIVHLHKSVHTAPFDR